MSDFGPDTLETTLRLCAETTPDPWYPRDYAQATGKPREPLEPLLDALRLSGLIRLTDWTAEHGQGYVLTPEGARALESPGVLSRLRKGRLPPPPAPRIFAQEGTRRTAWDRGEAIREALLGSFRPTVTYVVLAVNVLVFVAGLVIASRRDIPLNDMLYKSHPIVLENTGAASAPDIIQGQWWRLLTSCFVHVGLMHLGMNMYGLVVIGSMVERLFGHWRFLIIYLVSGFGGSCVGVLFQLGVAGASGALCGLIGAFAAWLYLNRAFLPPPLVAAWQRNILINAGLIVFISLIPGISWSGHLGGAVVGLLAGGLMNLDMFGKVAQRALAGLGLLALPVACYALLGLAPHFSKSWAELWGEKEVEEINQTLLPATRDIDPNLLTTYSKADRLLRIDASQRPPEQVEQVVQALDNALEALHRAAALFREAGPYHARAEEARRARLEDLEAWEKLFEMTARCLRTPEQCTPQEMTSIREQEKEAIEKARRWRSFLQ